MPAVGTSAAKGTSFRDTRRVGIWMIEAKTILTYASDFKILRNRDSDVVHPPVRRAFSRHLRELRVDRRCFAATDHSRRCAWPRARHGPGMGRSTSGRIVAGVGPFERRATAFADSTAAMTMNWCLSGVQLPF